MVKVMECPKCCKPFNHKGKFKKHLFSHEQLKPFKCPECGVFLSAEWVLKRHLETKHSGVKPYVCLQCDVSFTSKDHLHRHFNSRKHVPFKCERCGKIFKRVNAFEGHKCLGDAKESGKMVGKKDDEQGEVMENCGMVLVNENTEENEICDSRMEGEACKDGMEVDKEESGMMIKCPFFPCEKQYTTRYNLKTHIRTTHEKIGFTCSYCRATVMHNHTLKKHLVSCSMRPEQLII